MVDYIIGHGGDTDGKMSRCKTLVKEIDQVSSKLDALHQAIENYRETGVILNCAVRHINKAMLLSRSLRCEPTQAPLEASESQQAAKIKETKKKGKSKSPDRENGKDAAVAGNPDFFVAKRKGSITTMMPGAKTVDKSRDEYFIQDEMVLGACVLAKEKLASALELLGGSSIQLDSGLVPDPAPGERSNISVSTFLAKCPLLCCASLKQHCQLPLPLPLPLSTLLQNSHRHLKKAVDHMDRARESWERLDRERLKEVFKIKRDSLDTLLEKPKGAIKRSRQKGGCAV